MPDQDPQPIELRLRAYAEKRRSEAGGPFTPPPATRRRLRAEVDRRWGQDARSRDEGRWWDAMWPRLGWALGLAALLVIVSLAVLDLRPPAASSTLAKNSGSVEPGAPISQTPGASSQATPTTDTVGPTVRGVELSAGMAVTPEAARASAALTADALAPRPAPAVQPAATSPQPPREAAAEALGLAQATHSVPALAVSPGQLPSRPTAGTTAARGTPGTTAPRSNPMAAGPAPITGRGTVVTSPPTQQPALVATARRQADSTLTTDAARFASQSVPSPVSNQQQFVQAPLRARRQNMNSPPPSQVLQRFEVRQVGSSLQVRDGDGSLYAAEVPVAQNLIRPTANQPQSMTAPRSQTVGVSRQQAVAAAQNPAANNFLFFNATGTNRTLQQRVVFEGRLLYTNDALPAPPAALAVTNEAALGVWLNNSLVEGEAVIGERTRIEIQAAPDRN